MIDDVLVDKPNYRVLYPLDLPQVTLGGEFGRRVDAIIEANILKIDVEKTFIADFRRGGNISLREDGHYVGLGIFIDSLVRLAAGTGDARLVALKKKLVGEILSTQDADGYIGVFTDSASRGQALWDLHEGAYIIWGLVSDYRLLGEAPSLEAAKRLADFFIARPAANPTPGVEFLFGMTFDVVGIGWDRALLALYEASGHARYRNFVVEALKVPDYGPPIRCGNTSYNNHAYTYFSHCLAQLDLYRQSGDIRLLRTSHKAIEFLRKGDGLLVTGSCSRWECWHDDQSGVDNLSETCAGAYLARLLEALLQIEGDSLYGDMMERDIYNALFAATAPDGSRSRYFTPFDGERPYDPNGYRYCCANNNKRFLADLRSWIYYRTEQGLAVNLYTASTAAFQIKTDLTVRLEQQTDYPSSGHVRLKVDPSRQTQFEVKLRIPRWCKAATLSVNGKDSVTVSAGQFYGLTRRWSPGDVIELQMPMEWRLVRGRRSQTGRAAILRGPVLFTFNPDRNKEMVAGEGFDPRSLKIHPGEVAAPVSDESIRPGGIACRIQAWPPRAQPWLLFSRVPLELTEYPDPRGQAIYFITPGEGNELLTEDELI